MQKINAKELLKKYQNGECSDEELALLEDWYNQYSPASPKVLTDSEWAKEVFSILKTLDKANKSDVKTINWQRIVAAASIILCLSIGSYFWMNKLSVDKRVSLKSHDINPGGNKALLTLANGQRIILNSSSNGLLAQQGNTAITKNTDGIVVYRANSKNTGKAEFNKIVTPAGGQYRVVLSDGTSIWLNSSSSINFPTSFPGNKRIIEFTGEAYFEVAHNAAKPFVVKSNGQTVQVLGTHFNINAYTDEPSVKTTLLEGSVKISANGNSGMLKPGQQGIISKTGLTVTNADVDQAVGWKNGDFIFNNEDLQTVMRQISRWYDVDVTYKSQGNYRRFFGTISRSKKLSEILKALEMNQNVHFKTEGRTIEVTH